MLALSSKTYMNLVLTVDLDLLSLALQCSTKAPELNVHQHTIFVLKIKFYDN